MIKFFRRIRQQLLKERRFSKYFFYAIGEIFLVVVGILIAVSINNWNENRKKDKEEISLLVDIKKNLETMLVDFDIDIQSNAGDIVEYEKLAYYIENDLPYAYELDSVFGILTFWDSPFITATAYNTLQSKGLDIIKNETLKKDIIELYEVNLKILTEDYDHGEYSLQEGISEPFLAKHVRRLHKQSLRLARPNDFESLKKNDEFLNILSLIIRQRKRGIEIYEEAMILMNQLIDKIELEVDTRNHSYY
jgi:hypothetical protein